MEKTHSVILLKIYVPLSAAALATLFIFSFVGHWNSWFDGLIYMNNVKHYPLQTYIQIILSKTITFSSLEDAKRLAQISQKSLQSAYIFISIIPILILFPSIQRYYSKGIVLGATQLLIRKYIWVDIDGDGAADLSGSDSWFCSTCDDGYLPHRYLLEKR